jgi:hypothetical protein
MLLVFLFGIDFVGVLFILVLVFNHQFDEKDEVGLDFVGFRIPEYFFEYFLSHFHHLYVGLFL